MEGEHLFGRHHESGLDAFFRASQNPEAASAISQARAAGIPLATIIMTLLSQLPNIMAGNWVGVVAAIIALFTPKPPTP